MRTAKLILVLAALPLTALAAGKPCAELSAEIQAKLDAKGVKGYTLDAVTKDDTSKAGKVVGTCEGGTKKIIYSK